MWSNTLEQGKSITDTVRLVSSQYRRIDGRVDVDYLLLFKIEMLYYPSVNIPVEGLPWFQNCATTWERGHWQPPSSCSAPAEQPPLCQARTVQWSTGRSSLCPRSDLQLWAQADLQLTQPWWRAWWWWAGRCCWTRGSCSTWCWPWGRS